MAGGSCGPGGMRVGGGGAWLGAGLAGAAAAEEEQGESPACFAPVYERHPEAASRAAVATTVRGAGETLVRWARWHLSLGFCRLIVYFDDPSELPSLQSHPEFRADRRVLCVPCDAAHWRRARSLRLWPRLGPHYESEVQARQQLNAEAALGACIRDKVGWLLHIDADELFVPGGVCGGPPVSAPEHFGSLSAAGVSVMSYVNHEGVPERAGVEDFFAEVTLFRRSLACLPPRHELGAGARAALAHWTGRSAHGQYFLGYENGKAAVAVAEGAVPLSVHEWLPPTASALRRGAHNIRLLGTAGALAFRDGEPACVLHFISCGLRWWRRKYELLGDFPDAWFGGALPIPPCFHLQSRDAVRGAGAGGEGEAEAMYERSVVLADAAEAEAQVASGVLFRYGAHVGATEPPAAARSHE